MTGITARVAMEEPEVGDLAELLVNDGSGYMTVQVLARHDCEHEVNMYPGGGWKPRMVPSADLRPCTHTLRTHTLLDEDGLRIVRDTDEGDDEF